MNTNTNETPTGDHWSEHNSLDFLELGELFVPARAEQIATLLDLIPAQSDESFAIVELGAGGGQLARAILERFPYCRYFAFDGSSTMREHLTRYLATFEDRVEILPFELAEQAWWQALPSPLRCVLSSLCVHHLTGPQKRQFFSAMHQHLEPGGALLLADVIEPATPQIATLFARQYDDIVREQSLTLRGDLSGYEQFREMRWNYFSYDYGTPESETIDHPSFLNDQLHWLEEAGFSTTDCFWMRAGHAIYGGYK